MTQDNLIARLRKAADEHEVARVSGYNVSVGKRTRCLLIEAADLIERLSPPCPYCKGRGGWTGETKWGEQDADCDGCDGTGIAPTPIDGEGVIQADERVAEEIVSAANIVSHDGYYEADVEAVTRIVAAHRRAALAALTPREQIRREAFEEAARACEDRAVAYQATKAPGWRDVLHECTQCAEAIRALSLQDKT